MSTSKGVRMPRNYEIAPGLYRFSKARMYHKRGLYEKMKKPFPAKPKQKTVQEKTQTKKIGGDKNGGERVVALQKPPKYLPVVRKGAAHVHKTKKVALRKSITPGTILIILVGRHRGKRVVFLKQLEKSGLLLVTGPLKLNATPLRRIAQAFVIATQTKLDIGGVQVPDHINDDYFKRATKSADKSKNGIFATNEKEEYVVTDQRKEDQKKVDSTILSAIRSHPDKKFLFGYLGSRFSLGKNDYPHQLKF